VPGLSVLSRHNLRLELAGNHIVILDVDGFPLIRRWYAVEVDNAAEKAYLSMLDARLRLPPDLAKELEHQVEAQKTFAQ